MLYQPVVLEINWLMQRARRAWPHMTAAIDKAQIILQTQAFAASTDHFLVNAHGELGEAYPVSTDIATRGCSCRSFTAGGYIASGRQFCKHLIAVEAYLELLRDQLRQRLFGDSDQRAVRQKLAAHPRLYLMRISNTPTITNMARDRIFFAVRWGERQKLTFGSDRDAITFSHWLALAPKLPEADRDRYDSEIARQQAAAEWQVNLTPEQLKRWYDTGSVV